MPRDIVTTSSAPEAVGPYSQAVVSGGLVYCSGQIPLEPSTGAMVEGGVEAQARRCMDNLAAVLEAAGSGLQSVLKVTAYLTDMGDFPAFNDVYATYFDEEPPARATVGVAALPKGARVEVDCIAAI